MADETDKEFASYREMFSTEEEKQEFDRFVTRLLALHGVEYVRGYVDALRQVQKQGNIKWR